MTATPASILADGSSTSAIQATVTKNGPPLAGDTVNFTMSGSPTAACGTLSPTTGTTDGSGHVNAVYTSSTTAGTCTITATETQGGTSGTATVTQTTVPPPTQSAPCTIAPNLKSVTLLHNGFNSTPPSTVAFTFDGPVGSIPGGSFGFKVLGPDTRDDYMAGTSAFISGTDNHTVIVSFSNVTVNISQFQMGVVDSRTVADAGGRKNSLGSMPLIGAVAPGTNVDPQLLSTTIDTAANTITYTFDKQITAPDSTKFVFYTSSGTRNAGTSAAPPAGNSVVVTFGAPVSTAVREGVDELAVQQALAALGDAGYTLIHNPEGAVGANTTNPELTGVARTGAPNVFNYTFNMPVLVNDAEGFTVRLQDGKVFHGTTATSSGVTVQVTFTGSNTAGGPDSGSTTIASNLNADNVVLGTVEESGGGDTSAVKTALLTNDVGAQPISGGLGLLNGMDGPVLKSATYDTAFDTVKYTFDRKIDDGGASGNFPDFSSFFIVSKAGTTGTTFGTALATVSGTDVTIQFPLGSVSTATGAGVTGSLDDQNSEEDVAAYNFAADENAPGSVCGGPAGGGGAGGGGGSAPCTIAPNLKSVTLLHNGFNSTPPSTVAFTFDGPVGSIPGGSFGFKVLGPDTRDDYMAGTSAFISGTDNHTVIVSFSNVTVNISQFQMGVVDSRTVADAGGRKNSLGSMPLIGAVAPGTNVDPQLLSTTIDTAANTITYTFDKQITAPDSTKFVFYTSSGTRNAGTSAAPPRGNSVVVTFGAPVSTAVREGVDELAVQQALAALGDAGYTLIHNPEGAVGANTTNPELTGVARTGAPNVFNYTFNMPVLVNDAEGFTVRLQDGKVFHGTTATSSGLTVQVTFTGSNTAGGPDSGSTTIASNLNADNVVLGTVEESGGGDTSAVKTALLTNDVGAQPISGGLGLLNGMDGPVLKSATYDTAFDTVKYTFDRKIDDGGASGNTPDFSSFFIVSKAGTTGTTFGTALATVSGTDVTIQFPLGSVSTAAGAGATGSLDDQNSEEDVAAYNFAADENAPGSVCGGPAQ